MPHAVPAKPIICALCVAVALTLARPAAAQIHPGKACAHAKGPIPATLDTPGQSKPVELTLELINPATAQVVESRPAKPGDVDLAEIFPRLWTNESGLVFAVQAVAADERIGPPLVLVPMVAPRYAPRVERDGAPQLLPAPKTRVLAGYWLYTDQRAVIRTSKGEMVFALRPDAAPHSVANFRWLIEQEFYDGIKVHRIAALSGRTLPDIMQFGDPSGTGQGGPGYFIDYESSPLKHGFGSLSLARTGEPNSAGSQVIVAFGREAAAQLDGKYTVFGQLVSGGETLSAIAKTPTDADGKPREAITIESARLVDAPPFGAGPKPETDPNDKPTTR
jgi:peptidyl-prolyl cis-trans isomerase B (cyclophilin B)